jgi:MATE family multidrug resistance protein
MQIDTGGAPARSRRPGARRAALLLRHESNALLRIAGPIVLSQLGGVGMNTMDTIMVGPLGAVSLAAVGLGAGLHMAAIMVSTGVLLGMGPLVSQAFGAGNRQECRHVLMQGLWLALAMSVPMIALNVVGEPLALALGQDPLVAAIIGDYMWALAWGVVPLLLFMAFRGFLEGMGIAKPAMVITFIGLGVNFIGNSMFIHGVDGWIPAMGAVGAGWSTTLVRWSMLIAMAIYIIRHPGLHPFRGVRWRPESLLLRRITTIGAPTGGQMGLEVGLFVFAAVMMGWFGAVELGTHQVTLNIAATTFMVALGVSIAGSIRVGQHIGARNHSGLKRSVVVTHVFAIGFMGLFAIVFVVAPESLLRLYTDDPEILRLGAQLLPIAAAFQVFDGAQVAGFCVLRGAADTRVPMLISFISFWMVGAVSSYVLGFVIGMGPVGVWIGLCIGLATASALLLIRIRRGIWRRLPALA